MKKSKKIVLFSDDEEKIIRSICDILTDGRHREDLTTIQNNRTALEELARCISLYPSILGEHTLAGVSRSIESLVESLCNQWGPDMILHIPTKAILGRGYTIAKINFFLMLRYITQEISELSSFEERLVEIASNNVFSLTAEEVFLAIIENTSIPETIRHRAGHLTTRIWEYRLDYGVKQFAPILQKLWNSREKLMPHFGTMMGFSELFMISKDTETEWFDFLQRDELSDDEVYSLEEFIFGLTYEEIQKLRTHMEKHGRKALNAIQARELLGSPNCCPGYGSDDPRDLYQSFRERKNHGRYRSRAQINGPKKTLEEYLMTFLLQKV